MHFGEHVWEQVPEIVPFRLTRDIVAGLGCLGADIEEFCDRLGHVSHFDQAKRGCPKPTLTQTYLQQTLTLKLKTGN